MIKVYNWLAGGLVIVAAGFLITTSLSYPLGNWGDTIKWTGLSLQISGMLLVFRSLTSRRSSFGVPSTLAVIRERLCQLWDRILRKPKAVTLEAHAAASSFAGGRLKVRATVGTAASVEQKVEFLLNQITHLNDLIYNLEGQIDENGKAVATRMGQLKAEQKAVTEQIKERLKEIAVGDVHLDEVGAFLLVVGSVLSTIPEEIVSIITNSCHLLGCK